MFQGYLPMVYTLGLMCGAVLLGRIVFGLEARHICGFSYREELTENDNSAVIVRLTGMLVGLMIAVFGTYRPVTGTVADVGEATVILLSAFIALMASRYINDRFILSSINNNFSVVKERNVSVATVEFATYIATALIFVGGMVDASHGIFYNIVWFVMGQSALIGLAYLYRFAIFKMSSGEVLVEIGDDNRACALSLAGILLSGGIAISALISGVFSGWLSDFIKVGEGILLWAVVMVAAKALMFFVIIPGNRMVLEMTKDRNWAIGFADAAITVAFTSAFVLIHG